MIVNASHFTGHWMFVRKLTISMAQCKKALSPLLTHWRYCSLELNHRYDFDWRELLCPDCPVDVLPRLDNCACVTHMMDHRTVWRSCFTEKIVVGVYVIENRTILQRLVKLVKAWIKNHIHASHRDLISYPRSDLSGVFYCYYLHIHGFKLIKMMTRILICELII